MSPHLGFPRRPTTSEVGVADRSPLRDGDFAERVMAAIEREPAPTPTRNLLSAVRTRSAGDAASALWVAWHLATVRRWPIAPGVRARSIALVLAAAFVMGTGSLAAAAGMRVAADPIVDMFQSGVDEQGPMENASPNVGPQQNDQPGINEIHPGDSGEADQPGVYEPGVGSDEQGDQPGAHEPSNVDQGDGPDADQRGSAGQNDQSGVNQSAGGDAGQSGGSGGSSSGDGSGDPSGTSGTSGSNQDGSNNDGTSAN